MSVLTSQNAEYKNQKTEQKLEKLGKKQKTKEGSLTKAGNGLLFHALGRNTIGAENFHGRVRNGIVCSPLA